MSGSKQSQNSVGTVHVYPFTFFYSIQIIIIASSTISIYDFPYSNQGQ